MERLNEQYPERRLLNASLRAMTIAAGFVAAVVGAFWALGDGHPTEGAPSVMEFVLRPVTPAQTARGTASWRLLAEQEQPATDDVVISIGFGSTRVGGRKSQRFPELMADVLAEPGRVSLPDDLKRRLAVAHIDQIADEAERRAGIAVYATAVQNLGEWVAADGGRLKWAWPLLLVGVTLIGVGVRHKRLDWRDRLGRGSKAAEVETGRSGVA